MDRPTALLFPEYADLRRVAVCRPAFFELRQPINVIQAEQVARGTPISVERATAEHAALVAALHEGGADVIQIAPDPRRPYQINARDAGLGTPNGLLIGAFRFPIRQGEEASARAAVEAGGGRILGAIKQGAFEGGDFMALGPGLAAIGLGPRTQPAALDDLRRFLGPEIQLVRVPFEGRYLHLDMIFNVIADQLALACPAALPPDFLALVRVAGFRILEVSEEEVFTHGCNVLATGHGRIISHIANGRVNELLRAEGLEVVTLDLSELARSGGGPRCLTLPIERRG